MDSQCIFERQFIHDYVPLRRQITSNLPFNQSIMLDPRLNLLMIISF